MPICQLCLAERAKKTEYVIINTTHLVKHGVTLKEYIERFGDPSREPRPVSVPRRNTTTGEVVAKLKKPKKVLNHHQEKTIEDIYVLEETIEVPDNFIMIVESNKEMLTQMLECIYKYKRISIDTETTGLDMFNDHITDIIISVYEPTYMHNYFIPFEHVDRDDVRIPGQLDIKETIALLRPIIESETIMKSTYNDYFDAIMLWTSYGIELKGLVDKRCIPKLVGDKMVFKDWDQKTPWLGGWDGLIGAKILNENETSHKMKDIYKKYLHADEPFEQIKRLGVETFEEQFGKIRFYRVPLKVATCYAGKDGYMTRRIEEFQKPYIDKTGGLSKIYYGIEMPLLDILIDMRKTGIAVDLPFAKALEDELVAEREITSDQIKEAIGDINLNSPKQLSNALFNELKYPRIEGDSTKASVLEELAERGYEVAELIHDYKKKEKIIGTYLTNLPELVSKLTGRVHCRFNQSGTKTGRFSSSDPNLQNLPAKFKKVRRIFKASEGYALISGDFSQIEPRLLSHVADDPIMIQTYLDDKDIYSTMAAKIFSLVANRLVEKLNFQITELGRIFKTIEPEAQVEHLGSLHKQIITDGFTFYDITRTQWGSKELTSDDCFDGTLYRKFCKTLLLGMMYAMSEKGLSARLKIDESDAKDIMDFFFKAFPNIKKKTAEIQRFCKSEGYVETDWGRKRRLPDIWSEEFWIRKKAERQVLNSVIQGGAADLMKIAILLVGYDQRIKDLGGRLLLTVHDELILEAPKENAIQVAKYLIEDMINVAELKVPLKVDAEIYTDGRWYGESIDLKRTDTGWRLMDGKTEIQESDINWTV